MDTIGARFGALTDHAPIGIGVSRSGVILYANYAYMKMFGFERMDEIIGKPIADHWSPEWRDLVYEHAYQCPRCLNVPTQYEVIALRKEGSQFPAQVAVVTVELPDGQARAAFITDLTEPKQAEEALRQRNRYIKTILEEAPIGFAVHTMDDGVGRFVSARFEEIYGVPRGMIDSHYTFFDKVWRYDPDFREQIRRRVVADMASGDPSRMHWENVPVRTANGETRYITAMNIAVPEQNLMVSTVRDVTEHVQAQEALRESEERLKLATDSAAIGLWSMDLSTQRVWVNPLMYELFQFPAAEELTWDSFFKVIHPEDRAKVHQAVERAMETRAPFQLEYRIVLPDCSFRWIVVHGLVHNDVSGNPNRIMGVSMDITERKRAEEADRDMRGRLMSAQEAERCWLARELHDDVTQRLALLAIDAARAARGLGEVSPAETMRSLHEGLVCLSEDVHSLSYRLHPSILEDLGLAVALKAECDRLNRQESLSVVTNLDEVPPLVPRDAALGLFRVVQEALRNIARHARAHIVEVSLRGQDGGLQLTVHDDGVGFDRDLQRKRPTLGLAGMRERVYLLGGKFDIESAPGHGTTVVAWVPLKGESS